METTLTRPKPEPTRRRAPEEKRELILAAARELFADQGFDDTSTVQIADQAGVSEGILFHHFGSKRGLFAQLAEQYAREAAQATMPDNPDEVTEETIVRAAFDFSDREPRLYRLFWEEGAKLDGFGVSNTSDIIVDVIQQNLERGMADGLVRNGDPRVMAELQFTVVDGAYRAWRKNGDPKRKEAYIEEAIRCMRAMLAPTPTNK